MEQRELTRMSTGPGKACVGSSLTPTTHIIIEDNSNHRGVHTPTNEHFDWSDELASPIQEEVVIESDSSLLVTPKKTELANISSTIFNGANSHDASESLHFNPNNSMKMRTCLMNRESRTSFEHVNQIIKHGAKALVCPALQAPIVIEPEPFVRFDADLNKNVVKKVLVLQSGDDAEQKTTEAINEITQQLNIEAAKRFAQGRSPEKETVIEITRIKAPDGALIAKDGLEQSITPIVSLISSPERKHQKHHRRKSPHPKRYMYHSPSSPLKNENKEPEFDCSFQSQMLHTTPHTGSSKLLGRGAIILQAASQNTAKRPTILRPHKQSNNSLNCSSINVPRKGVHISLKSTLPNDNILHMKGATMTIKVEPLCEAVETNKLNDSLTNIQWLGCMSGDASNLSQPKRPVHRDYRVASDKQIDLISRECGRKKRPPYSYMHLIQMAICSDSARRKTLKEIYQWIEDKFPYYKYSQNHGWKNSIRHNLSLYDIFVREKTTRSQGPGTGKSGSSYWTLRSDVPLKPAGMKSAHILNHHSIDRVREKVERQPLYIFGDQSSLHNTLPPIVAGNHINQIIPKRKGVKGPVPLLPKPPPVQTYALIPIQGGVPVIPDQPIMVSSLRSDPSLSAVISQQPIIMSPLSISSAPPDRLARPGSAQELMRRPQTIEPSRPASVCGLPSVRRDHLLNVFTPEDLQPSSMTTSLQGNGDQQTKSNLKRISLSPSCGSLRKQVKITSKVAVYDGNMDTIVKHELRTRSNLATCTVTTPQSLSASLDSTDLINLSQMRLVDSGIISDCSSNEIHFSDQKGLPKPVIYRRTSPKSEAMLSGDSSLMPDLGIQDILYSIEKSLSTPLRNLLTTPPKAGYCTSTPFKIETHGSLWVSDANFPDNLFTPVKGENISGVPYDDEQLRDPLENPSEHFPDPSPLKTPFKSPVLRPTKSPLELIGTNQSFSKLLGDFHLESMIDEGINLDVSNMSFSAFQ